MEVLPRLRSFAPSTHGAQRVRADILLRVSPNGRESYLSIYTVTCEELATLNNDLMTFEILVSNIFFGFLTFS